jgi:hypothetical protein
MGSAQRLATGQDMAKFFARRANKHAHRSMKRTKTRAAQKRQALKHQES